MKRLHASPGLSLVELLIFVGLLAMTMGAVLAFSVMTADSRARQQTAADVEQNIIQLQQFLETEVRHAERITMPARGESGSLLVLQSGYGESNPVIIATQSGMLLLVRKDEEYVISPPEVTVSDMRVFNTSPSDDRQSLAVRFTVSRVIPLPVPLTYSRTQTVGLTVYPDDYITGSVCNCGAPRCDNDRYEWEYCESSVCTAKSGSLLCP